MTANMLLGIICSALTGVAAGIVGAESRWNLLKTLWVALVLGSIVTAVIVSIPVRT